MGTHSVRRHGSRRRFERIQLRAPIDAQLGNTPVLVNDLSLGGANIEHRDALPVGSRKELLFCWAGDTIAVPCTVLRCKLVGFVTGAKSSSIYSTGVKFDVEALRNHPIRQLIEARVRAAIEQQRANARGEETVTCAYPEKEKSGDTRLKPVLSAVRDNGFICFRKEGNVWKKNKTQNPEQPAEGFTVLANEDPEELELLCRLYDRSDVAMRGMIRILAQLSVTESSDESRTRYVP
ncbi:MAG TPA: PilZ domain-containing protein [Thermoanaerobaculia bacterium]